MEPDTPINPHVTVGDLTENFEGSDHIPNHDQPHFICDWCSQGVAYQSKPRVGHYVADDVLNENHPKTPVIRRDRPLVQLASYCPDCSTRLLLFPCKGVAEARVFFDLDEEQVMKNVEVRDVSPRDDGIPWDPREVSARITGIEFSLHEMFAIDEENHLWAAENIVTWFLAATGIDIREMVRYDGSIDPQALGRARKAFEEFREEMKKGGFDRQYYRDAVKDRRK